jgi:hypothetical protein
VSSHSHERNSTGRRGARRLGKNPVVVREKIDVQIARLSVGGRWANDTEIETRADQNRELDRCWSTNSRTRAMPPANCKEFAGIHAKPCKFHRLICDDSRVCSTAWKFFTVDYLPDLRLYLPAFRNEVRRIGVLMGHATQPAQQEERG